MQAYACGRLERPVSVKPKSIDHKMSNTCCLLVGDVEMCGTGIAGREWGNSSHTSCGDDLRIRVQASSQKIPGSIMKNIQQLTRCPKCGRRLCVCGRMQICIVCGYWTFAGTARMDSIVVI